MWSIVEAGLFFALVPGVVVSLPSKGSLMKKAAVHALVFAVVMYVLHQVLGSENYTGDKFPNATYIGNDTYIMDKGYGCWSGTYSVGVTNPAWAGRKACRAANAETSQSNPRPYVPPPPPPKPKPQLVDVGPTATPEQYIAAFGNCIRHPGTQWDRAARKCYVGDAR